MTPTELLAVRYKVIADYPHCGVPIGFIYENVNEGAEWFDKWPHLFKKLEWWEERTIEQFKSLKYVKVIKYVGYWLVGDIVETNGFIMQENKPYGYKLTNHFHPVYCLLPATKEDFLNQDK